MQARRAFLFKAALNSAAIATGGSLVVAGKEQVKEKIDKQAPKEPPIGQAIDFAFGGTLGFVTKTAIQQSIGLIGLKRVNKKLASAVSELQKLEKNDLPGIERTLKDFVAKEGIIYKPNQDCNLTESITGLLNAILIHVNARSKAVQPFLEELQGLREAIAQPFTKQLQSGGDVDAATRDAVIQVLRSKRLTEYLITVIVNALNASGAGEKIGTNTVNSLAKEDLISDDAVVALRETVVKVLKSEQFVEALQSSTSNVVFEYDIADKLAKAIARKFKTSLNGMVLPALKEALNKAIDNSEVAKNLAEKVVEKLQQLLDKEQPTA